MANTISYYVFLSKESCQSLFWLSLLARLKMEPISWMEGEWQHDDAWLWKTVQKTVVGAPRKDCFFRKKCIPTPSSMYCVRPWDYGWLSASLARLLQDREELTVGKVLLTVPDTCYVLVPVAIFFFSYKVYLKSRVRGRETDLPPRVGQTPNLAQNSVWVSQVVQGPKYLGHCQGTHWSRVAKCLNQCPNGMPASQVVV